MYCVNYSFYIFKWSYYKFFMFISFIYITISHMTSKFYYPNPDDSEIFKNRFKNVYFIYSI